MDFAPPITDAIARHPKVKNVELMGSRARGDARPESDWDFRIEARDFTAVARALPALLAFLDPLAAQWDRLSSEQCWMLIVRGPTKVDLIFPDEPHEHEPPWAPCAENLAAIDAHFWDWMLWLRAKVVAAKNELVVTELQKLFEHILRPLGVSSPPTVDRDAVSLYRSARAEAEATFGSSVPRDLEQAVGPAVLAPR